MSEGSATDSDVDNKSRYGVDVETDEEDDTYFDTNDFLSSESLRSALYRSRDSRGNGCSSMTCEAGSFFSDHLRDVGPSKAVDYPYIKRRDNLPEPKGKEKPVGLWSIIKDNIGNDLSEVSFPVYFNEPYLRCKNALKIWSTTTWLIRRWNRESRIRTGIFCRNPYNVIGICNKSSHPLAKC